MRYPGLASHEGGHVPFAMPYELGCVTPVRLWLRYHVGSTHLGGVRVQYIAGTGHGMLGSVTTRDEATRMCTG